MFKPNFQYTNTIVKNLTHIAKAQAVIENSPLIPKWQISLVVAVIVEAIRKKVIGLSKDIKTLKQKGQIALTERQMKIVERIITKGAITNREARKILGLSDEGIRKEITKLIELGVLTKVGEGRSTHYVLS